MSQRQTTTDRLFNQLIERIQTSWPVGTAFPSERVLMEEFGVSRNAVREAVARLRALGVLDVGHGRSTVVTPLDTSILGKLVPLMLTAPDVHQTSLDIFQVRLALETEAAYLASLHRTPQDLARLEELRDLFAASQEDQAQSQHSLFEIDLAYHVQIARSTGNPLFGLLLEVLSNFVLQAQQLSCGQDDQRHSMAVYFHNSITQAIAQRDAARARVEMESHLRASYEHLKNQTQQNEVM